MNNEATGIFLVVVVSSMTICFHFSQQPVVVIELEVINYTLKM
jgi:hypothetical protein